MNWDIEYTDEFGNWWATLSDGEQEAVAASIGLLEKQGTNLGYPHSSSLYESKHEHMRELRIQHKGRPLRVLYAFDPRRVAILLLGGDKTGDDRWYKRHIPEADKLYDRHLDEVLKEGFNNG